MLDESEWAQSCFENQKTKEDSLDRIPVVIWHFLFRSQVRFHRTSWKRLERSVGGVSATLIALGHILVNHRNSGYGTNAVRNTKYHWWSFVFVNLFEQLM